MITLTREEAQQVLDALKHLCAHTTAIKGYDGHKVQPPINMLKAKLKQPKNSFNPDWDAMAVMVEEQQRMAKRIEGLEAQLAQPEPAECDGGQCGIGGYCKDCPKTKPELKIINMENFVGSGKPLVPVCWMNANDIDKTDWKVWAHGKPTVSMPLFASPPKREWVGLTHENIFAVLENLQEMYNRPPTTDRE